MTGSELRKVLKKLGLTQELLAKELSVTGNTIARWERDEVSIPPHLPLALETVERKLTEQIVKSEQASKD